MPGNPVAFDRLGVDYLSFSFHKMFTLPSGSCRLSFYLYNTRDDVDRAVDALHTLVDGSARARRQLPSPRRSPHPLFRRPSLRKATTSG